MLSDIWLSSEIHSGSGGSGGFFFFFFFSTTITCMTFYSSVILKAFCKKVFRQESA